MVLKNLITRKFELIQKDEDSLRLESLKPKSIALIELPVVKMQITISINITMNI